MLGNEEDARFIRDWHMTTDARRDSWGNRLEDAPEGWKRIGSGCYRVAYLSPDGVVYKVQSYYAQPGQYESQSNRGEAQTIRRYWLRKMPKGCRLPRFQYFDLDGRGVIAMERFQKTLSHYSSYDEEGSAYWALRNQLQRALNLDDMHGGNLAVDEENKLLVPIDLGA